MKSKFVKVVDSVDIVSTRLFLANELMLDPRGKTYHEMKQYAESKLDNLYEPDNGMVYNTDETTWDKDFLFSLKNDLDYNFSKERMALYENVIKIVLKEKAEFLDKEAKKTIKCETRKPSENPKKTIYATVTAGSAAVALTGFCISRMALASLGVVGVVIGGVLLYNESKR